MRDLALAYRRLGIDVEVVSLRRPEAHVEVLRESGIPVWSLDMEAAWAFPAAVVKFAALVRRIRANVVHSHCYHANILCRAARLLAPSARLVCTAHSTYEVSRRRGHSTRKLRDRVYRYTDRLSHYNTHVSQQGLERYLEDGLFQRQNASWVPNGIDFPGRPSEDARRKRRVGLGWESDVFVWLHAGRLSRAKNQRRLLEAFAEVAVSFPNTRLAIAGGGELEAELKDRAKELGIGPRVEFLGMRDDVPKLMACADGFAMSSDWEGLPIVLLEAAAAGLPCVATNVGSIADVLGDSDLLVPAGEPGLLAQAMRRMMQMSDEERRQLGESLRNRAKDRFAMDRVVEQWLEIYERIGTTHTKPK